MVETSTDRSIPDRLKKFLEWLDEIRYEHRQKAFMRGTSFAVFGIGKAEENNSDTNKAKKFKKYLKYFRVLLP